jgi:hypothetical protein
MTEMKRIFIICTFKNEDAKSERGEMSIESGTLHNQYSDELISHQLLHFKEIYI